MIRSAEYVLSERPFVVRRQVRWGDCDPAGVVYTGRFTEYLLGAVGLFADHLAGNTGESLGQVHGVGTPCRGMAFDFAGTLWPNDVIDITCTVGEIRERSYDFHCVARKPDGTLIFRATFSPICVRLEARQSTPIPPSLRAVLQTYCDTEAAGPTPQRKNHE